MRTTHVWCSGNLYRLTVGPGALQQTGEELRRLGFRSTAVVVTDETVGALFGADIERSISDAGLSPHVITIPPGEDQKSLATASVLYEHLNEMGAERSTPLVALGGGVIGDLTGFVAATYFRGLPLLQIPTTLLAQVDSSIGGKVAINHGMLKNNVGAFHQPLSVIADTSTLLHLPARDLGNGLAEVVKSAMIRDAGFFEFLEASMDEVLGQDSLALEKVVALTARIKSAVVQEDERDSGLRNILNFGHTIGHGIETASEFALCHGEGVAIGMVAAARLARTLGMIDEEDAERLSSLLLRAGLPVRIPADLDPAIVMSAMARDKKRLDGRLRFILPTRVGEVVVRADVPEQLVEDTLLSCYDNA
ncbi:MAG: 3-dehydroquinate synthase [Dehalococcoidia bacterium]|nr:3-dehydroquinate synthase [Dehalococcoidia bacterium]